MSKSKVMEYEQTPIKNNKISGTKVALAGLERVGTASILWYLVKRHRVGLLATWAGVVTLLYIFPPLPDLVLSLITN